MLSGLNKELLNLNDRIMKYLQIGNQLLRRNVHELQNKFVSLELQKTYLSSAEDEIIWNHRHFTIAATIENDKL